MHELEAVIEAIALGVDVVASLVMVWAFAVGVVAFVRASLSTPATGRIRKLQVVRCDLGIKLVFALELLIISDLLHTVVSRSVDDLIFLGVLVVIRTTVAFFLNREIQEVSAEMSG